MKDIPKPDRRRKYDAAFRTEALRLAEQSRSTQAAARALSIDPKRIYQWQKAAQTPAVAALGAALDPHTAAELDLNAYIHMLARDGNITLVGAPEKPLPISAFGLILGRRSLSGSAIGGLAETQEMLDFCGKHNITSNVEVIPIQKVNEAYERMVKSDVKYRFSIDMASLKSA